MPDNDLPRLSTLNTHGGGARLKATPQVLPRWFDDVEMWKGWSCSSRYFLNTWVNA
jgi:hypothetical protein